MKKPISLVLAAIMAISCLSVGTTAFAVDGAKTAQVEFSVYDGGIFTMEPQILTVSADADNAYADAIGYNDDDSSVTVFDAIVTAHVAMFGEDFMTYAPMEYASGMLKKSFGEETTALSYRVNGLMANDEGVWYNLDSALADGDSVEYMFYQDATFYGDKYTRFDKRRATLAPGESLTLTLSIETYDESWNTVVLPLKDFTVTVDGISVGSTDADGRITIPFNDIGEYRVSANGLYSDDYDDYDIFAPFCTVKVTTGVYDYIEEEEAAAAEFLFGSKDKFAVDESVDFLKLIRSGYDVSRFADYYAQLVEANLLSHGGKLKVSKQVYDEGTGQTVTDNYEDLGAYGAVILVLTELGYDTTSFNGYNINEAFEAAAIDDTTRPNPYHYQYAIEAASPARAKAFIDDFIANGYTLGSGLNYWGYNCDNTCHFLVAIAPYAADYPDYVTDAKNVIKTYLLEEGYYCDPMWAPLANADSTALAMAAFASVGDTEDAFSAYKLLVDKHESKTGIFRYGDEAENYFATMDALYSLYYLNNLVKNEKYDTNEHIFKLASTVPATCTVAGTKIYKCVFCDIERVENIQTVAHTPVVDAAVAPTFKKAGKTEGSHCSVCGKVLVEQKKVNKLGAAKLSKVKKGKNAFTATWKKVKGVDGYQIRYSTSKKFKKKKTITVKNAKAVKKTVKKLKAKKVYYVKIRAYKTINGKKQFSKWSKAKKVETK